MKNWRRFNNEKKKNDKGDGKKLRNGNVLLPFSINNGGKNKNSSIEIKSNITHKLNDLKKDNNGFVPKMNNIPVKTEDNEENNSEVFTIHDIRLKRSIHSSEEDYKDKNSIEEKEMTLPEGYKILKNLIKKFCVHFDNTIIEMIDYNNLVLRK